MNRAKTKAKKKPGLALVQARIKTSAKKKLALLAEANHRKTASYVALILEDHAENVDLKTVRAISRAWQGVSEDRGTVVTRKDGPK